MNCVLRVYLSFTPTASAWQRPVSRWFSLLFRVSVLLDTNTLNASLDVNKAKKKDHLIVVNIVVNFWCLILCWNLNDLHIAPVLCSAGAWPLSLSRQSLGEVPMNRQAPIRHLGIYSCWRWSDDKLKCSDIFICLLVDDKPISINLFCRYVNRKNTNGGTHGRHANLLLGFHADSRMSTMDHSLAGADGAKPSFKCQLGHEERSFDPPVQQAQTWEHRNVGSRSSYSCACLDISSHECNQFAATSSCVLS